MLIEEAVTGSEVGCAVMGDGTDLSGTDGNGTNLVVGELDQISLSHGLFRIHQERDPERGSENSTITVPAAISDESRVAVHATAKAIYRAVGCGGLARVDMFLTDHGEVVLNEVNTLPGLTSYSRFPRMMAAAGLPLAVVIDRLVSLALARRGR